MRCQRSAMRSAFQAIRKFDVKNNDIRNYVKYNYMNTLNQRYISDAVSQAKLYDPARKVIFGGKQNWKDLQSGLISKEEQHRIWFPVGA